MQQQSLRWYLFEAILPFIVIQIIFLVLLGNVLEAQFDYIDDYMIHITLHENSIQPQMVDSNLWANSFTQSLIADLKYNRFRPVYWASHWLQSHILGLNPYAWHLYRLESGVFVSFLLYLTFRQLGLRRWLSALAVWWITVSVASTSVWARLGPAENQGMVLLSISLFSLALAAKLPHLNRWDILMLVTLWLAGWVKETFILVAPSVILFRIILAYHWHSLAFTELVQRFWKLSLISGLVCLGQLSFIFIAIGTSYLRGVSVGISDAQFSFSLSIINIIAPMGGGIPLLISPILIIVAYRQRRVSLLIFRRLWLTLPILLWIIPQLIIYYPSIDGHYVIPGLLGFATLTILWVWVALKAFPRVTLAILLPCVLIAGYFSTLDTYRVASYIRLNTQAYQQLITLAVKQHHISSGYTVLVFLPWELEPAVATFYYLGYEGVVEKLSYDLQSPTDTPPDMIRYQKILEDGYLSNVPKANILDTNSICQVIVRNENNLADFLTQTPPAWFNPSDYEYINIHHAQEYWAPSGNQKVQSSNWILFIRHDCNPANN